ncbi:MAG: NADH:ubiquinone reductase (Na(+)-transporting) subunit F [Deltaproteobacteria bacterium]|nr:NADH:ubiquinone reductase (Na(+)-transporting) subunit F [Deltaproteobacteria bacterium]
MTTVIVSIAVFTAIIMILTFALILAEKKLMPQGNMKILINDEKTVEVPAGGTLLTALGSQGIFIPSACGGGGTCAMCRCKVFEGGGEILATETGHISRGDAKAGERLACQVKVREDMKIGVPEEIFSIRTFTGTVESNDNCATFIKATNVTIDGGETLNFKAGGYIQWNVPEGTYKSKDFDIGEEYRKDWDGFKMWDYTVDVPAGTQRAYSMANHPAEGNKVMTTIRFANPPPRSEGIPPGLCSSWIFTLKAGDKVTFSGPYGEFFINDSEKEMVYIGGGAGMAPMRSHIFHLFHTEKTTRKVRFFYGARSQKENFYMQDFLDIEKDFENFTYTLALSDAQPEDNWTGPTGFIHQVALEEYLQDHEDPTEIEYYLCGPPMMIDAVTNMLYELGVEDENIRFDKF